MRRGRWLLAVKAAVSIGLLAWLVSGVASREGMPVLVARASSVAPGPVVAAVGLHLTAVLAGVLRWRVLLQARGLAQPLPWLVRSFLIGRFVGAFTPSTAGLDGFRAIEVARRTGDAAGSASVMVVEKLFGLVGMAVVCAALAPLGALDGLGPMVLPVTFGVAAVAASGIALLHAPAVLKALAARAPGPLHGPAGRAADALARHPLGWSRSMVALGLGVASHLALSATFAAAGAALAVDVSWGTLLSVGNATVVAVLLPVSIGGIGVREGVAVALLSGAGVSTSEAVLVALTGYVTGQVPALLGGLLLVLERGPSKDLAPTRGEGAL